MSCRKFASGYEKLKKKRREESLIQSQKGALDKFLVKKHETIGEGISEKAQHVR